MFDDMTPRYAPERVLILNHGTVPVRSYIFHPAGEHPPKTPIIPDIGCLELRTDHGSRWYGCASAYINSELRMVVVGTNSRDEVRMKWQPATL